MGPTGRFLLNGGGFNPNSRDGHAAEIGSANGITNGRGLAGLYAPLANGGTGAARGSPRPIRCTAHGSGLGRHP